MLPGYWGARNKDKPPGDKTACQADKVAHKPIRRAWAGGLTEIHAQARKIPEPRHKLTFLGTFLEPHRVFAIEEVVSLSLSDGIRSLPDRTSGLKG
jgi:hypothetical protein